MKRPNKKTTVGFGVGAIVAGVAAITFTSDTVDTVLPPEKYQGPGAAYVGMSDRYALSCGIKEEEGQSLKGCYFKMGDNHMIMMPNPCDYKHEEYASWLCHEKGHALGWPADHPRVILTGDPDVSALDDVRAAQGE